MSLIREMRRQKAVWWKKLGTDRFGEVTYDEPVEIDCRWVDQIGEFRNAKAEAINSKAVVYVDREMSVGDMLAKGAMQSDTPADPKPEFGANPIVAWGDTPDISNLEHLLTAHL